MIQEQKKNSVTVSATLRSSTVILSPRLSFSILSDYLVKFPSIHLSIHPSRERERERVFTTQYTYWHIKIAMQLSVFLKVLRINNVNKVISFCTVWIWKAYKVFYTRCTSNVSSFICCTVFLFLFSPDLSVAQTTWKSESLCTEVFVLIFSSCVSFVGF